MTVRTTLIFGAIVGLFACASAGSGPESTAGGSASATSSAGSAKASIEASAEYQDPTLLEEAWRLPVAQTYSKPLSWQVNGAYCGPSSAQNALRTLGVVLEAQDDVLANTTVPPEMVKKKGMTLDQLAEVIRAKSKRRVEVIRDVKKEAFRAHLEKMNLPDRRYIANFFRPVLFGRAGGHHSPIGGYLASRDLVFVLDVNEKYKPWLVSSELLYDAINTIDPDGGQKRGLIVIYDEPDGG